MKAKHFKSTAIAGFFSVLIFFCFLPLGSAEETTNYYAVLVGIADYPGTGNDLDYTDDDAVDMKDALLNYPNWSEGNITMLLDAEATKLNIGTAIQNMGAQADSDDVCLFFYSGHGTVMPDAEPLDEADGFDECLVPYSLFGTITDDELSAWLGQLPTTNVVVIIDTCFSGGQIKGADRSGSRVKSISTKQGVIRRGDGFASDLRKKRGAKDLGENFGYVIMTACDDDQYSWEFDNISNGLFTYYLTYCINNFSDLDLNGELSAEEVGIGTIQGIWTLYAYSPFFHCWLDQTPQLHDNYPALFPCAGALSFCLGPE